MTADLQQELESVFHPHTHPRSTVDYGPIPECVQGHRSYSKTIKTPAGYFLKCLCGCGHGSVFGKELS